MTQHAQSPVFTISWGPLLKWRLLVAGYVEPRCKETCTDASPAVKNTTVKGGKRCSKSCSSAPIQPQNRRRSERHLNAEAARASGDKGISLSHESVASEAFRNVKKETCQARRTAAGFHRRLYPALPAVCEPRPSIVFSIRPQDLRSIPSFPSRSG